jgi:hypothetical protein
MSVTVRPYVNGGWEVDIRVPAPGRQRDSRAQEGSGVEQAGGGEMGRVSRASAARPWQAEAGRRRSRKYRR